MILGKIVGKVGTNQFSFIVTGEAKKFQYVQIEHPEGYTVLGQIADIEKEKERQVAHCQVIGYRDKEGLNQLRVPLEPETEVLRAEDTTITRTLGVEKTKKAAFIGRLNGRRNIPVFIDINKMLTKHVSILAKTGAGKSYTLGVILEELIERNVPILIIDPHGEYTSLKYPNEKDKGKIDEFGINPVGYKKKIREYSPDIETNPEATPLKLNGKNLGPTEIIHLLPAKLSNAQIGLLYAAVKNLEVLDIDNIILEIEAEDNPAKWTLINILEYIKKLDLFSESPTRISQLIQPGLATIINLKGTPQEVQEVIVYKIIKDLFEERKKGNVPPCFLVTEEAHNYCPERSFKETKSSSIIRQIAAEGRKFGIGLVVVSQRPSRVDKSVLSQCSTQIILKVTNPNDVRAIANSVEGMTQEAEREIKNIPVGTAWVTGIVDTPLLVDIRPRKTSHGGYTVNIFDEEKGKEEIDNEKELLPVIEQKITKEDIELIYGKGGKIQKILIPCLMLTCSKEKEKFNILVNLNTKEIVTDIEKGKGKRIEVNEEQLSPQQQRVADAALALKEFKAAELFEKTGLQFSQIYDSITSLTKKGIFEKVGDRFRLAKSLETLQNLKEYATFEQVEYKATEYDQKQEKKVDENNIISLLRKFTKVINDKECWLVTYSKTVM
ncbi:ATP-binding protein [Candidatus Woesearchaeota archaeon]|nr:ATP-binding protein [Candidatus Woesearchaeota archaeon]